MRDQLLPTTYNGGVVCDIDGISMDVPTSPAVMEPRIKEEGSRVNKFREKIKNCAATLVHKRKLK
eukprot:scaffold1069_cov67-Attheya_sp.AAC.1